MANYRYSSDYAKCCTGSRTDQYNDPKLTTVSGHEFDGYLHTAATTPAATATTFGDDAY